MPGDNYGIQSSGGDVINHGVQAFGPGAQAHGAAPAGGEAWRTSERRATPAARTGDTVGEPGGPTVFVSYSHDSPAHVRQVLTLAELLVANGIHVEIDQWAGVQRRDWGAWCIGHIERADFVIIVASPNYHRVGDGFETANEHRGARSEAAVIRDHVYGDRATWVPKLLPVVLPGHDIDEIPLFLQPYSLSRYVVRELTDAGITELLRVLTGQPSRVRPALGTIPDLPPQPPALSDGPR